MVVLLIFIHLNAPNPLGGVKGDHVVSFKTRLPKEFGLDGYIDYDRQFRVSFLDPLKKILDVIGWNVEKINTLEDLFV